MMNESKGNMYDFISHTWNAIKGECLHDCGYCYMKRWGKLNPVRFDEKELKTDLGSGNFIFVGSSCDLFASDIPDEWIYKTIEHCRKFDNQYLFQTKNPSRVNDNYLPKNSVVCTTLETNRYYKEIMGNSPAPYQRVLGICCIDLPKYVTIEPIMDFDLQDFVFMLRDIKPVQVNIGCDSGGHNLPEPSKEKVLLLIKELEKFTTIHNKSNLKRLLK